MAGMRYLKSRRKRVIEVHVGRRVAVVIVLVVVVGGWGLMAGQLDMRGGAGRGSCWQEEGSCCRLYPLQVRKTPPR